MKKSKEKEIDPLDSLVKFALIIQKIIDRVNILISQNTTINDIYQKIKADLDESLREKKKITQMLEEMKAIQAERSHRKGKR